MRLSLLLCIAFGLCCQAQNPADLFSKAPPAVDEALRATVTKFYQAYVDGKFRQATQFVAEDSQDVFFEADKRRCHSFDIVRVDYADEFAKATVVIRCATDILMPPRGLTRVMMPLSSKWKVEQDKWLWYVPPRNGRDSPFGAMLPGEGTAENLTIPQGPSIDDLMKMITLDRNTAKFKIGEKREETFQLVNGMSGVLRLSTEKLPPDVKVRFERDELKAKETTAVIIEYEPDEGHVRVPGMREEIRIVASPLNRLLGIVVTFDK